MSKVDISKATPRPWFVQPNFLTIYNMSNGNVGLTCAVASVLKDQSGPDAAKANAELIRRAVNSYDAMLAALKQVRALVCEGATTGFNPLDGDWAERLYANNANLTRAIRLAEGKEPAA